eukprot:scaffold7963_cov116-Isochrysis_galbana.AAC.23
MRLTSGIGAPSPPAPWMDESMMERSNGTMTTIESQIISEYATCQASWSSGGTEASSATSGSRSRASCGTNLTIVL